MRAALLASVLALLPLGVHAQDRVLSVGGSLTEVIYALGAGERLIARDTTSTHPAEALALPDVGYMRALSPEGVLSVSPDLIVLDASAGPPETLAVLEGAGVKIARVPESYSPEGVLAKVAVVAEALGMQAEGAALSGRLKADMEAALAEVAADGSQPKVLFILSNQGGQLTGAGAGTSAEAMIALAGGQNAVTGFDGYKALSDEAIANAAPDVILTMDRGDHGDSEGMAVGKGYLDHPALAQTPAGQAGRMVRLPGMFLLGFGPRTPEAIRALHDALSMAMKG